MINCFSDGLAFAHSGFPFSTNQVLSIKRLIQVIDLNYVDFDDIAYNFHYVFNNSLPPNDEEITMLATDFVIRTKIAMENHKNSELFKKKNLTKEEQQLKQKTKEDIRKEVMKAFEPIIDDIEKSLKKSAEEVTETVVQKAKKIPEEMAEGAKEGVRDVFNKAFDGVVKYLERKKGGVWVWTAIKSTKRFFGEKKAELAETDMESFFKDRINQIEQDIIREEAEEKAAKEDNDTITADFWNERVKRKKEWKRTDQYYIQRQKT